jgi:prepilin-type N-terminal cleavage/methylation domain-containing protein/prepilin-type processing-associated H-X9-DG protein
MNRSAVKPNSALQQSGTAGGIAAFTLVELLVVMVIIALLASMVLPALARAKESARGVQCLSQMRQLGMAVRLYADEHLDEFPRSQHSAFAFSQLPWGRAVAPQLGSSEARWTNLLAGIYHCPKDKRTTPWSYGQNVYFELTPDTDDYVGSPQVWRRTCSIPRPVATILQAETSSSADHIMPHFWQSVQDAGDVDAHRHKARSNYNFVDGHAAPFALGSTYEPARSLDLWNPGLAH